MDKSTTIPGHNWAFFEDTKSLSRRVASPFSLAQKSAYLCNLHLQLQTATRRTQLPRHQFSALFAERPPRTAVNTAKPEQKHQGCWLSYNYVHVAFLGIFVVCPPCETDLTHEMFL